MDAKSYAAMLDKIKGSLSPLMCEYCGVETLALGGICMCSNCEGIASENRSKIEGRDQALADSLESIREAIEANKYDEAIAAYDSIVKARSDPMMMYAEAIACIKQSNYEIEQISYMRPAFMEQNTVHRDKAAKLVSTAKKLLQRSISIANGELKNGNKSPDIAYGRFLAQIKMENMRGAKSSMEELSRLGDDYAHRYAMMVFEANMERFDNVIKLAEALTGEKSFSINAYYYMGLALFKKKKFVEAKIVLEGLGKIIKSDNLESLIFEVSAQMTS